MDEILIKKIVTYLEKEYVNDKNRLKHIYSVEKIVIELGEIYNVNKIKLRVVALLHDSTKNLSYLDSYKLAAKRFPEKKLNQVPKSCLHAYSASQLAVEKFNICDPDVLNAIAYHCSGTKSMTRVQQILFVGDYIEETRVFTDDKLRKLAKQNLDKATYEILKKTNQYLVLNKRHISKLSIEALDYYKTKMEDINER